MQQNAKQELHKMCYPPEITLWMSLMPWDSELDSTVSGKHGIRSNLRSYQILLANCLNDGVLFHEEHSFGLPPPQRSLYLEI